MWALKVGVSGCPEWKLPNESSKPGCQSPVTCNLGSGGFRSPGPDLEQRLSPEYPSRVCSASVDLKSLHPRLRRHLQQEDNKTQVVRVFNTSFIIRAQAQAKQVYALNPRTLNSIFQARYEDKIRSNGEGMAVCMLGVSGFPKESTQVVASKGT